MPVRVIAVGAPISDLVFHPTESTVYTGLLTGAIKAFTYDNDGNCEERFSLGLSKRPCRALAVNSDGSQLWVVGKGKAVHTLDTGVGKVVETRSNAHESAINRIQCLMADTFSTGDDDGVIKLWDTRQSDAVQTYTHHRDYVTDFLWLEDKKQLVATSGDGTLSVMDVRSKKVEPSAQSENQEDELLSITAIKGGSKVVVGTQLGVLSIFNRSKGWGDCVDRVVGHPHSVDAICPIPFAYDVSRSAILTGSSDGMVRALELFPTKLIGVVAEHGTYPVERMAVDRGGQGRWLGSVGHDDKLRMTDLEAVFEKEEEHKDEDVPESESGEEEGETNTEEQPIPRKSESLIEADEATQGDSESEADLMPMDKKRKRKKENGLNLNKKKGRNDVDADASFFAEL